MTAGIYEDLTGKRYGRWTVVSKAKPKDKRNKQLRGVKWLCKCDCGNMGTIETWQLTSDHSKSCGCYNLDLLHRMEKGLAAKHQVFNGYKQGAKKRSLEFEITFEEYISISKQKCYYCGKEPNNYYRQRYIQADFTYQGMDRVDCKKGYTIENIVPCCRICNRAKSNMTQKDFLGWVNRVHEHRRKVNENKENHVIGNPIYISNLNNVC